MLVFLFLALTILHGPWNVANEIEEMKKEHEAEKYEEKVGFFVIYLTLCLTGPVAEWFESLARILYVRVLNSG